MNLRHGSLYSGIGGWLLAAEWAGIENVFSVEIDKFCNRVLGYHFPKIDKYEDIKNFKGDKYKGTIDILSTSDPCQPYSLAGKRKGTGDDRYLWRETIRVIQEIQPRIVVGENVPGILNMEFKNMLSDLEESGYISEVFVIPACAVNAPHRRDRVWFVAHCNSNGLKFINSKYEKQSSKGWINAFNDTEQIITSKNRNKQRTNKTRFCGTSTDTDIQRQQTGGKLQVTGDKKQSPRTNTERITTNSESKRHTGVNAGDKELSAQIGQGLYGRNSIEFSKCTDWSDFPTQSPIRGGNDGISFGLSGITFSKWRNESIKAMGNAIVPQIAYEIFKALVKIINDENK